MENVKLSELPSETMLSYEDSNCTLTPNQLREQAKEDGDLLLHTWYVANEHRWYPDAKAMLRQYIETQYDEMYEDWAARAFDCLKKEHYDRIQIVLNEAFASDHVTKYWMLDGPEVIIDTLDQPSA